MKCDMNHKPKNVSMMGYLKVGTLSTLDMEIHVSYLSDVTAKKMENLRGVTASRLR